MKNNDTWSVIEGKLLELRILTNANWKNSEWELAALGERIMRSVEAAKAQSESIRSGMESQTQSMNVVNNNAQTKNNLVTA
jgi:hypothetical protein